MSVLKKVEKKLLNKFADTQPALNKAGLVLGESQIKLGNIMGYAAASSAAKFTWDFSVDGATGTIVLGSIPEDSIVVNIALDKLGTTVDSIDGSLLLDGNAMLANTDLSTLADVSLPSGLVAQKSTDGLIQIQFANAPTSGKLDVYVQFLCATNK